MDVTEEQRINERFETFKKEFKSMSLELKERELKIHKIHLIELLEKINYMRGYIEKKES